LGVAVAEDKFRRIENANPNSVHTISCVLAIDVTLYIPRSIMYRSCFDQRNAWLVELPGSAAAPTASPRLLIERAIVFVNAIR
jgi:hypothetical protein